MSRKLIKIYTGNQECADKLEELLDNNFEYTVINVYDALENIGGDGYIGVARLFGIKK